MQKNSKQWDLLSNKLEIQAKTFLSIVEGQLVSKRDLKKLKLEIAKIDSKIELSKRDLKICFAGMLVVAVSVLSGMVTLIVHLAR
jgi:hypothetical protein